MRYHCDEPILKDFFLWVGSCVLTCWFTLYLPVYTRRYLSSGSSPSPPYARIMGNLARSSAAMASVLGGLAGFMLAYQSSAGRLRGFLPNESEVAAMQR